MAVSYKEQMKNRNIEEFTREYLLKFLNEYYSNLDFQYYLIKFLRNREFCMLPAKLNDIDEVRIRNIRCHNVQSFQFWMRNWRLFQGNRIVNFYYSLAEFKDGVPPLYEKGTLVKESCKRWNDDGAWNNLIKYDVLIDIDAGSFNCNSMDYARNSAEMIQAQFDFFKVPYRLRFSGRGFHFIIPFEYFKSEVNRELMKKTKKLLRYLYFNVSEMVDTAISDIRRVVKVPMSISVYEDGAYVCVPIHDLKNFYFKDYSIENFKEFEPIEDKLYNPDGDLEYINGKI